MKNHILLLCLYLLGYTNLHTQEFLPPPVSQSISANGVPLQTEALETVLPTSDGGYMLIGTFLFSNSRYGLILKFAANGTFSWLLNYGNTQNSLSEVYFYDAVEANGLVYIVGDGVLNGTRYPFTTTVTLGGTGGGVAFYSGLPAGKGLAIEQTFDNTLLIGGYVLDGAPINGDTQGYVRQIGFNQNTIGSTLLTGSKIGEITRNEISGGYYAFGTYYDPSQEGCTVHNNSQFSWNTTVSNDRGDIYVARISSNYNLSWQRFIGGESDDTFLDGVVANDGGFAVLARAECESFFGDDGPFDVCNDSADFQPYWFYKGTSSGTFDWARSVDSYDFIDATQMPFGIIPSCSDDIYIVANNTGSLTGTHIGLDQLAETGNQQFLAGTFIGSVESYNGQEITRNLNNQIIIGGTTFNQTVDLAYFRFSEEDNCCPAPVFYSNCSPNLSYFYNGFGLDYQFTVLDDNNYITNENWYINSEQVVPFGTGANYQFSTPNQYEVCYPTEDNDGCLSYCCETFCIDFQEDCLEGVIPPCPGLCSCVETDFNLPAPFQCESFAAYQEGAITPQSGFWRIWPGQSDANVIDVNGDKVLRLVSATPEQDVVYDLFSGTADNLECGRYRLSWELTVAPNAGAYYNLQYDKNQLGQSFNFAYEVFFNPDGTGYVTNGIDPQENFFYLPETPVKVTQIIDLDQGDGIMEFWLNGDFKFSINYGARADANGNSANLGAIDFFADSQSNIDYQVDDLCIRTTDTSISCGGPTEPICVENGEQYNNICRANNLGLYSLGEFEECLSICEFNAEFIGRNERTILNATLTTADEAPSLLLSESCVASAYGGEVPFPFYTDIFIFENTALQPININPTAFGPSANAFVFQCNPDVNGNFNQSCLGSYLDVQGQNQAPGIYYILVTSSEVETYGIVVTPSTDCVTENVPVLSCTNNTYTGGFPSEQNNFAVINGNDAYSDCYAGLRTYQLGEQAFRLEIEESSLVDITLSTSDGAAGVFLYNSSCGNDCVNYAEAPDNGGTVQISGLTLAPGNYYLVVDQETAVTEFTLNIACQVDSNNEGLGGVFTINGINPPDCELSDEFHTVSIQIENTADYLVGQDRFSFNLPQGGLYNNMLGQAYNGNETLVFDLPPNAGTTPCSFLAGDSMQLYIYKPNEAARTTLRQIANYAPVTGNFIDSEGRFTPEGNSIITDFSTLNTIFISFPTSFAFPPEASEQLSFWQIAGPWQAEVSDPWISVDQPEGINNRVITIAVEENATYATREGSITVTTTSEPSVSQTIQVIQRGLCAVPELIPGTQEFSVCQGDMVSLGLLDVGPGPDSIYAYLWSTGETTATVNVMPTESSNYSVTVSQIPGDYCRASSVSTFTVNVNPTVPSPTTTSPEITTCSDTPFPILSVEVDESLYSVNWYNSATGGILLQPNSTTYTPGSGGVFYAEAIDLANTNCRSQRIPITVTVRPPIALTTSWQDTVVCAGQSLSITTQASGGSGTFNYQWFDEVNNVVSSINSFNYTPSTSGTTTFTVEVNDANDVCQATATVQVQVINPSVFSNYSPPDESNCATDLSSYSIAFSTDGQLQNPAAGTLVDQGAGNYLLEDIPVGTDVFLETTNGVCTTELLVISPDCSCPAITLLPQSAGDQTSCTGEAYPPLSVSLEDPLTYGVNWYDDDGILVAENTLVYIPEVPGTFFARAYLRAAPTCLSEVATPVTLALAPAITLNTSPEQEVIGTCVGETITFLAAAAGGDGALSYEWRQDDLVLSSTASLSYIANQEESIVINLRVRDENNTCTAMRSFTINVAAQPNISTGAQECSADLMTYGIEIVTTNTDDLTVSHPDAIIEDNGGGNYRVYNIPVDQGITITASNSFGPATCEEIITVNAPQNCDCASMPVPAAIPEQAIYTTCIGESLPSLRVENPGDEYVVEWYNSSSDEEPFLTGNLSFAPTDEGTYYVLLRNNENGCTSTTFAEITLVINELPIAEAGANVEVCTGASVLLDAQMGSSGNDPLTYAWSPGSQLDNPSSATPVATVEAQEVLTLTVTDANQCSATDILVLTPLPVPEASINVLQTIDCFDESTGSLQAVVSGGTMTNDIVWSNGIENMDTISGLPAGDYQLLVLDANSCADSVSVTLDQPSQIILFDSSITPVINDDGVITPGEITVVIMGGTPDYQYNWLDMAGVTQATTVGGVTSEEEVIYDLLITDANGCQVTFPGFEIPLVVGTSTLGEEQEQILLYPNPTTGLLQIRLAEGIKTDVDVNIYNFLGQLLGQSQLPQLSEQSVALDLSNLPAGSYTIQLRVEEQWYNFKILKIR